MINSNIIFEEENNIEFVIDGVIKSELLDL